MAWIYNQLVRESTAVGGLSSDGVWSNRVRIVGDLSIDYRLKLVANSYMYRENVNSKHNTQSTRSYVRKLEPVHCI